MTKKKKTVTRGYKFTIFERKRRLGCTHFFALFLKTNILHFFSNQLDFFVAVLPRAFNTRESLFVSPQRVTLFLLTKGKI